MEATAVAGALFCGVEDGRGLLQRRLDSIELDLHGGRASKLEFDLAPLTLNLSEQLLDEALLVLKLAAKCAQTGHSAFSAFVKEEPARETLPRTRRYSSSRDGRPAVRF
jgi:hypothetical protein